MGPRQPGTNEIPGGPIKDESGNPWNMTSEHRHMHVISNIRVILEEYGLGLENIVDVLVFLTDMERDFQDYNEVYAEYFSEILPARTTVSVEVCQLLLPSS